MIASGVLQMLPVEDIELDNSNPRIRKFLEMYPEPTPEQIALALGVSGDDIEAKDAPTYTKLRNSILTNRGVIQPVIINRHPDGVLVCIDGNTRVAIYQEFARDDAEGTWDRIPALVHEGLEEAAIDAVRLQVHLVGPRPWDPYSKAKYLHHLRMHEHLSFGEIVDFCGGRQKEIMVLINAFEDMEHFYRPVVPDDGSFDTRRFSGFVELQKMPRVRQAVAEAGHTFTDFARWVHERKLEPLNTIRQLPEILRTPKAKEVFLKKGAREAVKLLDRPDLDKTLADADLGQLARALRQKIDSLPYDEVRRLRDNPDDEINQHILDVLDSLQGLARDLGFEV
jgi:hypothetical protein